MFRQLKLRDRLVIMAAAPLLVLVAVAIGLLIVLGTGDARPYGLLALAGVAVTAVVGLAVGRSVLEALSELTDSATALATAHRQLAEGEITVEELQPIPEQGDDHLGRLAGAINGINAATIEVSESQQSAVKAGLSNIVVNLARRSQTLLDRQVEYLDRLEGTEEDPDRLGELFKVDHLATRMRRNAESLMVLAEADPGRRRGGPVEIADVLRVAMGEVEAYQHIELVDVDPGPVTATAAVDLAHLAAELMENATQFSPPSTPVQVTGKFDGIGGYVITVADRGIGLTDEKLASANELLANPPELGLGMGRSLGFMVIGRLAQRLKTAVVLQPNGDTGAKAVVTVPDELFVGGTPEGIVPAAAETADDQAVGVDDAATAKTTQDRPGPATGDGSAAPHPEPVPTAPTSLASPAAPVPPVAPSPSPSPALIQPPAPPLSQPAEPGQQSSSTQPPTAPAQPPAALTQAQPPAAPAALTQAQPPAALTQAQPSAAQAQSTGSPTRAEPPVGARSSALERLLGLHPTQDAAKPIGEPVGQAERPADWTSTSPFEATAPQRSQPASVRPEPAGQLAHSTEPSALAPDQDPWSAPGDGRAVAEVSTQPIQPIPSAFDQHAPGLQDQPVSAGPTPVPEESQLGWSIDGPQSSTPSAATAEPAPQAPPETPPSDWAQAALDHPPAQPGLRSAAAPNAKPPSLPPLVQPLLQPATWTAPTPPAGALPPSNLAQALPSGEAFESGVASLLTPEPGPTTDGGGPEATASGLVKRQRGASQVPVGEGRRVAGGGRDPDEVRDRLSRYREGLKGKRPDAAGGSPPNHPGRQDTEDR